MWLDFVFLPILSTAILAFTTPHGQCIVLHGTNTGHKKVVVVKRAASLRCIVLYGFDLL